MYNEGLPNIILVLSVSLIIFSVGFFAFYTVSSEISYTTEQTELFTVTNPSVSKTCNVDYPIESIVSVEQFDGNAWYTVSDSDYTVLDQSVVVLPSGMTG